MKLYFMSLMTSLYTNIQYYINVNSHWNNVSTMILSLNKVWLNWFAISFLKVFCVSVILRFIAFIVLPIIVKGNLSSWNENKNGLKAVQQHLIMFLERKPPSWKICYLVLLWERGCRPDPVFDSVISWHVYCGLWIAGVKIWELTAERQPIYWRKLPNSHSPHSLNYDSGVSVSLFPGFDVLTA